MTSSNEETRSKTRTWLGRVLGTIVTLAFLGSAVSKLAHISKVIEQLTHAGIPENAIVPIAILELFCLTLYLLPRTSVFGTFLLTGYIGGAIVTHIIGRENFMPPLIVGILMFASAYLRNSELRKWVPFRSSVHVPGEISGRVMSIPS